MINSSGARTLCLLFASSPAPNNGGLIQCLINILMAGAWTPPFNDPDALASDFVTHFFTMGILRASSDFEIRDSQFNDVQGGQKIYINTFNDCRFGSVPFTTKGMHRQQRSPSNGIPSAQQVPSIFTYDPCFSKGRRGQPAMQDWACTCGYRSLPPIPYFSRPSRPIRPSNRALDDPLVNHYLTCVVSIQYLLADKEATATLIYLTVQTNATIHEAVRLLAAVHQDKRRCGQPRSLETPDRDSSRIYGKLSVALLDKKQARYTKEDAMAALLVVSSVLFDGGTGGWQLWLQVAFDYLDQIFKSPDGVENALRAHAKDDSFIFIVKNAFWFDVIASATRQQRPHYYHEIDTIFHPSRSPTSPPLLSMEDSIGCHNDIFWALNRTSAFSSTARPFLAHSRDVDFIMELLNGHAQGHRHPEPAACCCEWSRRYTSHMLCMATIVWLRSLMSGAHSVFPMEHIVQNFLQSLRSIPTEERTQRHIVRSSVFSIFICGLFVTQQEGRQLLQDHLRQQSTDSIGNCTAIMNLLESIWQDHDTVTENGKWLAPVTWRGPLKRSRLLLV
ncbi:hypothetical protein PTI98_010292 [Pleurotus ostreatus]|nr:hypothetical protein PTI98_010292 [Pleurotus ostreatus]